MSQQVLNGVASKTINLVTDRIVVRTWISNFLMGVGISNAIKEDTYWKVPIAVVFPSISFGYELNKKYPLIDAYSRFIQ